jgi:hypothetical protein
MEGRLVEAADTLRAYLDRMGAVIGALLATGHNRQPPPGPRADSGLDELAASREAAPPDPYRHPVAHPGAGRRWPWPPC